MNVATNIPNPLSQGPAILPHDWQMTLPDAASALMNGFVDLHRLMFCVLGSVFLAFFVLLAVILVRFRASRHPVPQADSGPFLQVAWVGLPAVLLVLMAIPALRLNAWAREIPAADETVEVIGNNGSWTYAYPDEGAFRYESHRVPVKPGSAGAPEGFAVNMPLIVPVGRTVKVLLTSSDLHHSWGVPSLGVRGEAVPGKITQLWFRATKTGTYYGLCSSLCGTRALDMPIAVQVVSVAKYRLWLSWALHQFSEGDGADPYPAGNGA